MRYPNSGLGAFLDISACKIDHWMLLCNKLKLNEDKTELIVISSKHRPCPSLDSVFVRNCVLPVSVSARNVGVTIVSCSSVLEHLN